MKRVFVVLALVGALALVGWSCAPKTAVPDAGEDVGPDAGQDAGIPEGWKEYRNEEWGVSFWYPSDWFSREYREVIEGKEVLITAFSDESLFDTLPPQPVFPISVFYKTKTVDEVAAIYTEAISVDNLTIGETMVKKIVYFSDLLNQNDLVYLVPLERNTLQFFVYDEPEYVSVAENMIATIKTD